MAAKTQYKYPFHVCKNKHRKVETKTQNDSFISTFNTNVKKDQLCACYFQSCMFIKLKNREEHIRVGISVPGENLNDNYKYVIKQHPGENLNDNY